MRSLLSVLLIASGAFLYSRLEAAPGAGAVVAIETVPDAGAVLAAAPAPAAPAAIAVPAGLTAPASITVSLDAPNMISRLDLLAQRAVTPPDQRTRPEAHLPNAERRLNPAVAGLLSAAIPGAGQIYNGSRMAYLFLGVESAAWIAHFSMRDTGLQKERQSKTYADGHWSWDRYRDPAFEDCPPEGHSDGGAQDSLLWSLFQTNRDEFYSEIGRLPAYSCGWDSPGSRNVFRDMQNDSSQFMSNSRHATTVVFLNHLVSAVHAARGAARHNAHIKDHARVNDGWTLEAFNNSSTLLKLSRSF